MDGKHMVKTLLLFTLLFCQISFGAIAPNKLKNISPRIKVKIASSLDKVLVSGIDLKKVLFINSTKKNYPGRKGVKFNCNKISKVFKKYPKSKKPILLASLNSPTGLISFEDQKFKGRLHILANKNKDKCDVVNEINMEDYISGLLAKEMNKVWPIEALKAQAVAARSYAVYKMISKQVSKQAGYDVHYDIENSEKHQVNGDFFDTNKRTFKASKDTEGEVLISPGGQLVPIFFHAKCGGKTLRPEQVWENKISGYQKRSCPFCHNHGTKTWKNKLNSNQVLRFVKWLKRKKHIKVKFDTDKILFASDHFRKDTVRMYYGDQYFNLNKSLFRRYFGRKLFPSNNFNLSQKQNLVSFTGEGLGHGVGLCQLGALDMAQMGWGYKKILAYYFPKHKLEKIY